MSSKAITLLLAAALLAAPGPARSGYNRWTAEGGPFGGRIRSLHEKTAGGELFAGTEGGGVFRRGADGWTPRSNGLFLLDVLAIVTSPTNPDTMFAGTGGGGVYRSANGGNSWFLVDSGLGNLTVNDLLWQGGGRLFAATGGAGVYYSDDAGANWFPSNAGLTNLTVRCLALAPSAPLTLFAGTDNGVFRSTDGGATWVPRSAGLFDPIINDLAVHPLNANCVYAATTGGGVYRTLTGGSTWGTRRNGMGEVYAEEILIRPDRPDTLWAATRSGVFETFDAGAGWAARKSGLADSVACALLLHADTVYVGTYWGGVYRSAVPSSGWTPSNAGLTNRFLWELAVSPDDGGEVWAAGYGGIAVSRDTGWTWSDASSGIGGEDARTVAVSPANPDELLAGLFYGGVWRSANGGGSWTPSSTGLPSGATVTAIRYKPDGGNLALCGIYGGMYRSTNGGAFWASSSGGLGSKKVWGLATVGTAPFLVYAGTYENGLFRSHDFGASWDSVPLPEKFVRAIAVDPSDTSIVYAGGYYQQAGWGGVYKSVNSGASWTSMNNGLENRSVWSLVVDPDDPSHLFVATAGGVYESVDGAASWGGVLSGLAVPDIRWVAWTGGRLLAGTFGGSIPWYESAVAAVPGAAAAVPRLTITARPNPFNPSTTLRVSGGPEGGAVRLLVHDVRGRLVRTLAAGEPSAGELSFLWDGSDDAGSPLPSGVYFASAGRGADRASRKIVLVR